MFDYTAIVDRLVTVSWRNDSHPTNIMVEPVYGIPALQLTTRFFLNQNGTLKLKKSSF